MKLTKGMIVYDKDRYVYIIAYDSTDDTRIEVSNYLGGPTYSIEVKDIIGTIGHVDNKLIRILFR